MNEVLDMAKRFKKICLLMKIYFESAYDCVNWGFLRKNFSRLNFGVKWRRWMDAIVFRRSSSMLINDIVTRDVSLSKGLR